MWYFIFVLEVLSTFSFMLFVGILDSKYYEKIVCNNLSRLSEGLLVLILCIGAIIGAKYNNIMVVSDSVFWSLQMIFHLLIGISLACGAKSFQKIKFKYYRQYLMARSALYFSFTFETITLIVCMFNPLHA